MPPPPQRGGKKIPKYPLQNYQHLFRKGFCKKEKQKNKKKRSTLLRCNSIVVWQLAVKCIMDTNVSKWSKLTLHPVIIQRQFFLCIAPEKCPHRLHKNSITIQLMPNIFYRGENLQIKRRISRQTFCTPVKALYTVLRLAPGSVQKHSTLSARGNSDVERNELNVAIIHTKRSVSLCWINLRRLSLITLGPAGQTSVEQRQSDLKNM